MLYVRYLHLTKAKHIHKRQTHPLVREDVTQGLWPQRFSYKKKYTGREPQESRRLDERNGSKPWVVKQLSFDTDHLQTLEARRDWETMAVGCVREE
jgi:hypothetical protein